MVFELILKKRITCSTFHARILLKFFSLLGPRGLVLEGAGVLIVEERRRGVVFIIYYMCPVPHFPCSVSNMLRM